MYAFDTNDSLETVDRTKVVHKIAMTFHCRQCNTVWGDSFGVCGEAECVDSIICTKVTRDVVVKDELESRLEGDMENCVYNAMTCSGCDCFVGVVIHSAPQHLAMLRSLFLIQKENMNCYQLSSGSMTKASAFNFDLKPIGKSITTLKEEVESQLKRVSLILRDEHQ